MSTGIIETIKKVALNAFEASNPVKLLFGTVLSTDPIEIQVGEFLTLTKEFIVLNGSVMIGDKVTLIRCQGGQKYVVFGTRTQYIQNTIYDGGGVLLGDGSYQNCKIYLSPSSQFENKYAYGDTNEAEQCQRIANLTGELLKKFGFTVKVGSNQLSISDRIKDSNAFGATVHIPIHTNAGGGNGALVLCRNGQTNNPFVVKVYDNLCSMVKNADDGIKVRTDLSEINQSKAVVVYVEAEYHDNVTGAKFIVENTETIAKAISNGVYSAARQLYGTSNGIVDKAVAWALSIARDDSHGYSQTVRFGPHYDCSSFVISAYEQAGVPVKSKGGAWTTSSIRQGFLACGFKDVKSSVNLSTGAGLRKGDVLLRLAKPAHAALVRADGGAIVHSSSPKKGILEINYYDGNWASVLRYSPNES